MAALRPVRLPDPKYVWQGDELWLDRPTTRLYERCGRFRCNVREDARVIAEAIDRKVSLVGSNGTVLDKVYP